mgnify:CR=1 FL=1
MPYWNSNGKVIGHLVTERGGLWLEKRVSRQKHQLKVPPAWCTDSAHLVRLHEDGALGIKLVDYDGRIWWGLLTDFDEHGFKVWRSHGNQVGLVLKHWTIDDGSIQFPLFSREAHAGPQMAGGGNLASH